MTDKARVVIADDDVDNARTVEKSVQMDGHQTKVCGDGEAALHLVKSWMPHLLILDWSMPKMSGLDCLKKVRQNQTGDYVSVILVTANSELDQIIQGLDTGADDYIVKPFRIDELRARVRANLRVKELHDSLRRANRRLDELASRDDVTGQYNMRYMAKRMVDELESAKKNQNNIACIMFDLDHFKQVNDTHDHLFGSGVIRDVSQVVSGFLRSTDIFARYGGDEYCVLLPNTPVREAMDIAEKMRKAIESNNFGSSSREISSGTCKITASFGVAGTQTTKELDRLTPKELLRSADAAMYSAKAGGRNRVETLNFI